MRHALLAVPAAVTAFCVARRVVLHRCGAPPVAPDELDELDELASAMLERRATVDHVLASLWLRVWPYVTDDGARGGRASELALRILESVEAKAAPKLAPSHLVTAFGSLAARYEFARRSPDERFDRLVAAMRAKGWEPSDEDRQKYNAWFP